MRSPMVVQVLDAEREAHAAHRAEEIDGHRIGAPPPVLEQHVLEQQRGPAAGALHAAIGDLAISSRARTGCETRTSSPAASMAWRNARRLVSATD